MIYNDTDEVYEAGERHKYVLIGHRGAPSQELRTLARMRKHMMMNVCTNCGGSQGCERRFPTLVRRLGCVLAQFAQIVNT